VNKYEKKNKKKKKKYERKGRYREVIGKLKLKVQNI
jgi:hypothetical protein